MPLISKEINNNVIHFERIQTLFKIRTNGEKQQRGSEDGSLTLRVKKLTDQSRPFITVHFCSLPVCHANITTPPVCINKETQELTLWLYDVSQNRNEQHKFIFIFPDDLLLNDFKTLCIDCCCNVKGSSIIKKGSTSKSIKKKKQQKKVREIIEILDDKSSDDNDDTSSSSHYGSACLSSFKQNRKYDVCDKEDNQIDVTFEEILQIEAGESQN
jgi:hypothetical protein